MLFLLFKWNFLKKVYLDIDLFQKYNLIFLKTIIKLFFFKFVNNLNILSNLWKIIK